MKSDGLRERLKTLQMGQTLEEFSERCDVPAPTLRRYITGARVPDAELLRSLAERLHVSMDWLMSGKMTGGQELTNEQIEALCSPDPEVLEIDHSAGRAVPVVRAYDDEKHHLQHWCIHCGCWHFHGRGDPGPPVIFGRDDPAGHRIAHCFALNSPYRKNGLILDVVGRLKDLKNRPRSRVARVCPQCLEYYSAAFNTCICGYTGPKRQATHPEIAALYRTLSMQVAGEPIIELPPGTAIPHQGSRLVPMVAVPLLGRVPAGIPEEVAELVEEYIALPGVTEGTYALRVKGESMAPTIRHDDTVLFRIDQDAQPGNVVVVNDDFGESMLKRLKKKGDEVHLRRQQLYPGNGVKWGGFTHEFTQKNRHELFPFTKIQNGVQGAGGSNPLVPTSKNNGLGSHKAA